ncbi:angiotensin-converting enzyme, partial [Asbolus verrucosus]
RKMNTISMYYPIILFFLFILTQAQDEESRLMVELEIADLELQDDCENLANVFKSSIIENDFARRIDAQINHERLLKDQYNNLKSYENIPFQVQRNWTALVKSGDTLLSREDWNSLVSYSVGNEELMHTTKVHCDSEQKKCPFIKNGYQNILEKVKNETILKKSWSGWQTLLTLRKDNFPNILNLIHKAALQNDQNDAKSYWEMLVEQEDAYGKADALWAEIQPLYTKLQNFVKTRIFRFYNIENNSSEIPVYLLGSNFGYDWSYIADIVLPHPLIHHKAVTYLKKTTIENIYKLGENLTEQLSLGKLGNKFWNNSLFNMTFCENHLLSFCSQDHSELLTCDKVSWVTYLDAFEVAVDVALRNIDYLSLSRLNLRYQVIDEAIKSLGSVLAIVNMRHNGILNKQLFSLNDENDPNKMTELLLTALRVLPKLPFYLAADEWRLHLLENGLNNIDSTWWQFRKDFQGVKGVSNIELDFLGEPYIMSNKPYLSKFFGTILQFQLLQNYKVYMSDPNDNIAVQIGSDENFLKMINEKSSDDWQNLISNYYSIYDLTASSLLDYFQPLENYLDAAPLEQEIITTETPEYTTRVVKMEKLRLKVSEVEPEKNKTNVRINNVHPDDRKAGEVTEIPNRTEKIVMYIGIGLLGGVAVLLIVTGLRKLTRRKRSNNRRFET